MSGRGGMGTTAAEERLSRPSPSSSLLLLSISQMKAQRDGGAPAMHGVAVVACGGVAAEEELAARPVLSFLPFLSASCLLIW